MKASDFFKGSVGTYREFVWEQVRDMGIDDLKQVDVGIKDIHSFRMNLGQFADKEDRKFKTKVVDGVLYVGRVR